MSKEAEPNEVGEGKDYKSLPFNLKLSVLEF